MRARFAALALTLVAAGCSPAPPAAKPGDVDARAQTAPAAQALLPWSEPAAGLRCRVEYIDCEYGQFSVMVRLENVDSAGVRVPADARGVPLDPGDYQMLGQTGDDAWAPVGDVKWWTPMAGAWKPGTNNIFGSPAATESNQTKDSPLILAPSQSVLVWLCGYSDAIANARHIRIAIRWRGTLQTPPVSIEPTNDLPDPPRGLDFPDVFPAFNAYPSNAATGNSFGGEPAITLMEPVNFDLIEALKEYDPAAVRRELDRRLASEQYADVRYFVAGIAVAYGSGAARRQLEAGRRATDYQTVRDVDCAISMAIYNCKGHEPDWLIDLATSAITDQRPVTHLDEGGYSDQLAVHSFADGDDELTGQLGHCDCRRAIPTLKKLARSGKSSDAVTALADMGAGQDTILQILRDMEEDVTVDDNGVPTPETFHCAVQAAGELKMRSAAPILLRHLTYPDVIESLESIGDPAAIAPLQQLLKIGKADQYRISAARIALATLEPGDPLPRYWRLLADRSLSDITRYVAADRLGGRPDPRSVAPLLDAVRTDPSGAVTGHAIWALAHFRYKSAVRGLIGCFDADFAGKTFWRPGSNAGMYLADIAESLRKITGVFMGTDKQAWADWMRKVGEHDPDLK